MVSQTPPPDPATADIPVFDPPFALPPGVELRRGLEFARPDGEALTCDLFLPRAHAGAPRPGIVWIHGGGWRNKAGEGKVLWRHAAHLAALGFPGVNLTYRLAPGHPYPAQVEDVRAGVRWVRRHAAELGIDPQRLGAAGESAGGHLAALLATTDAPQDGVGTRVQALVGIYGVYDFFLLKSEGSIEARTGLLGGDPVTAVEGSTLWRHAREASPLYLADARTPPTLLLHGTADVLVGIEQSVAFQHRLRELGIPADLIPGEGGGHGHILRPPFFEPSLKQTADFFVRTLAA
jgi:acetyl esterase/lipase